MRVLKAVVVQSYSGNLGQIKELKFCWTIAFMQITVNKVLNVFKAKKKYFKCKLKYQN